MKIGLYIDNRSFYMTITWKMDTDALQWDHPAVFVNSPTLCQIPLFGCPGSRMPCNSRSLWFSNCTIKLAGFDKTSGSAHKFQRRLYTKSRKPKKLRNKCWFSIYRNLLSNAALVCNVWLLLVNGPIFLYLWHVHLNPRMNQVLIILRKYYPVSPLTKWPPFRRRYFQMQFREWKVLYFDENFFEFCS